MNYYATELEEIYKKMNTNPNKGLSQVEAVNRLEKNGPNEIPKASKGFIRIYLAPLFNWLIVIYLIGALILYFFTAFSPDVDADMSNIYTTLIIVAINMIVAIFQQYRATKKLNALRELSAPKTIIIRDGERKEILSKEVVVGDLLVLNQGDKIPADARIIQSSNLELNEASLTGESEPAKKNNGKSLKNEEISIGARANMVFFGTFIVLGNGTAIIVKTGVDTEIGKISHELEEAGTGNIPIQEKMNNFGKYLGLLIVFFWVIALIITWIIHGEWDVVTSLTAAMDLMPLNIPLLSTVVLITGVLSMAKQGVIIRNLTSVDSLGRISVVCSDKTGTLTQSKMCIQYLWLNGETFIVTGEGYSPTGDILSITDPTNPTKLENFDDFPQLKQLITAGFLNNNSTLVKKEYKTGSKIIEDWNVLGSATEGALMALYQKSLKISPDSQIKNYELIKEYPFDSSIKRMSKVFKNKEVYTSFTKGASEIIVPLCSKMLTKEGELQLTDDMKNGIMDFVNEYASKGYRVLSLCYKTLEKFPSESDDDGKNREICESELTYIGFVTILDPPREGVIDSVNQCHRAGVDVIMITGDSPTTAKAISTQISIITGEDEITVEGSEIEDLVKSTERFNNTKVFARVSPKHKQQIIEKLQSQNKVVAMTGDGVNDALALNMADAGVAMGIQGTDVAKEAADMVISDDSFNSIVTGIHRGRGIFARIRAIVFFFIAINLFEGIVQIFLAVFLQLPYFLDAEFMKQWLFLSVTVHMFPGLALTFDTVSNDVMEEKPRNSEEILSKTTIISMCVFGFLLAVCMFITYFICLNGTYPVFPENYNFADPNAFLYDPDSIYYAEFGLESINLNVAKTLTMLMAVLFCCESALIFQIRRPNKFILESLKEDKVLFDYIKNKEFGKLFGILFKYLTILLTFACFLALLYIPYAQVGAAHFLNINAMFMYLTALDWLVVILISMICIGGFEIFKFWARKKGIKL
ncbi:MAG: cation-transporting P-type ATPase [archaeon]|nr:cation-transporting P-type ATPase [archaeon]